MNLSKVEKNQLHSIRWFCKHFTHLSVVLTLPVRSENSLISLDRKSSSKRSPCLTAAAISSCASNKTRKNGHQMSNHKNASSFVTHLQPIVFGALFVQQFLCSINGIGELGVVNGAHKYIQIT